MWMRARARRRCDGAGLVCLGAAWLIGGEIGEIGEAGEAWAERQVRVQAG